MQHTVDWFEIPASDLDRARKFYETILDCEMEVCDFGQFKMARFPSEDPKAVSGALCWGRAYRPTGEGTLVYFRADPDLSSVLDRVEEAGGKILVAKRQISPEQGYMGVFQDCEGNRVALRSVS